MKTVDIIIPVYNEEEGLPAFYQAISGVAREESSHLFTFLFVDDGSKDRSLDVIQSLAREDTRVKYISFSRNFGKEAAIYAGLQNSTGDLVILMDADLQHPPELIPQMLLEVESGKWDACGAKRMPGAMSRAFNWVNNKMSPVKLETGATDYMCMHRQFVEAVLQLSETQRFSKGLFAWVGFRVRWVDYVQGPRAAGTSKWNFRKLFSYAMDGITGFSVIPLKVVSWTGGLICLLAVLYILATLIKTLVKGVDVPGYATTLVIVLFLGGIILLSVGILGSYIGRIFMETKRRPVYIAAQTNLPEKQPTKAPDVNPSFVEASSHEPRKNENILE